MKTTSTRSVNGTCVTTRALSLARRRRRSAGVSAIEEMLMIAAIAACFIYPLSRAAMDSGRQISRNVEDAHETILRQP